MRDVVETGTDAAWSGVHIMMDIIRQSLCYLLGGDNKQVGKIGNQVMKSLDRYIKTLNACSIIK